MEPRGGPGLEGKIGVSPACLNDQVSFKAGARERVQQAKAGAPWARPLGERFGCRRSRQKDERQKTCKCNVWPAKRRNSSQSGACGVAWNTTEILNKIKAEMCSLRFNGVELVGVLDKRI